jgi:hypothetical protein
MAYTSAWNTVVYYFKVKVTNIINCIHSNNIILFEACPRAISMDCENKCPCISFIHGDTFKS